MKRFLSIALLAAILLPATNAAAVRYGVKKRIMLGGTGAVPQYLSHSSVSNIIYSGNTGLGTLSYINGGSDALLGNVAGAAPGAMVYDTVHNRVYLHDNGVSFYAIDCATNTLDTSFMDGQGGGPVVYSSANNKIYYLDQTFNTVHFYNGTSYAVGTPFNGSGNILFYQPGSTLYTAKTGTDSMLAYAGANDSLIATFQIPGLGASAKQMAANPASGRLYVALNTLDRVAIVNPATNAVLSSPVVGDNPAAFARCPIDNSMFVACNGSSQYSLWHITILGTVDSVLTGDSVSAVAYNPADSLIYIACGRSGKIKLVNPLTRAVVDSIDPTMVNAHYTELTVDNNGDVYCAAPGYDFLTVVGQIPHRMWRSSSDGSWYQYISWQYSDDAGGSWLPAMLTDTIKYASDSTIQIAAGTTISVDSAVAVDQLVIDGTLVQDAPLTISDGLGNDVTVAGFYRRLSGALAINGGATLRVIDGGTYQHDLDGGDIPVATWDTASTLRIDSIVTTPIASGLGQSFGTVNWNCQDQGADMTLAADPAFAARNLLVSRTGGYSLVLTSAVMPRLTIPGNLGVQWGQAVLGSGGVRAVSVGGIFEVSNYGAFYMTDTLNRGIDTLYLSGDCYFQNIGKSAGPRPRNGLLGVGGGGPDSSWVVFNGHASQDYYDDVGSFAGFINFRVDSGAFLRIGNGQPLGIGSQGSFLLYSGAALGIDNMQGIYPTGQDSGAVRVSGTRFFSKGAHYYYSGYSGGAYYTGPGLPDTVRCLTAGVSYGSLTLTSDLAVTDTLGLAFGPLSIAGRRLALYGPLANGGGTITTDSSSRLAVLGTVRDTVAIPASVAGLDSLILDRPAGIWLGAPLSIHSAFVQTAGRIHSNWLQYDPTAVLLYNRPGADTTSDGEFPVSSGPRNVVVNAAGLVHLHADRTIPGTLTLQGWLAAGSNTVTIDSTGALNRISGFVSGNLAKYVRPNADTTVTYELGEVGKGYAPVTLRLFNNTVAGFLSAGSFAAPQGRVANAPACMQKHWSFTSPGMSADSCRLSLVYATADFNPPAFDEAAHEAAMPAGRYDHGASPGWHLANVIVRTPNGTADGGWLTISHPGLFAGTPDFQLGRDTLALWAGPDSSGPRAPVNLTAGGSDPSPWYNGSTDSVRIRWQNPFDTSGVGMAYYKRFNPPNSNGDVNDSIRLSGASAADSFMLPVATVNAAMPLYVWLKDTVGNVDYTKAGMVTVRRDTTAPTGIIVRSFGSDTINTMTMYAYLTRGNDALSGLAAYRLFCQCDTPGAVWDTVGNMLPDTMAFFGSLSPGYWYKFEATGVDSAGNWEPLTGTAEQRVFVYDSMDVVLPTVGVIAPDSAANWQTGSLQSIVWNQADPYGMTRRDLFYRVGPAAPWVPIDTLYGYRPSPDTAIWMVPNTPSAQAQIKVVVYDVGGNWTADSSRPFVIGDSIPPSAFGLTPFNGDTSVPALARVEVYFTEAIQDTSLRFTCLPAVGGWQRAWDMGGSHLVMTHDPFRPGTSYALSLTGARDLAGNPLDSAGHLQSIFRTRQQRTYAAAWTGKRYRLFSLPMVPADSTAAGLLGPALGQYSDTTWLMYGYDPVRSAFVGQPSLSIGRSYWLASSHDASFSLAGSSNDSVTTVLTLQPGWNLIGDPFTTALTLGQLQVTGDTGATFSYDDTTTVVNGTLLRQRMWSYDDATADFVNNGSWTQYTPFDSVNYRLQPWQGYAVYAVSHCRVTCNYSPVKRAKPAARPTAAVVTWRMRIDAEAAGSADRGLEVGLSPQAQAGYDRMDAEKPPLVSNEITASIPHPEWRQGPCSNYQYDYRPAAAYIEWPLLMRQNDPAREGTLRFETSGTLPAGQRVYLVDRKLGTATEITGGAAVSFSGSCEFAVISTNRSLGDLRLKPLAFGLDRLYPNPFREQAVISYQVPAAGRVSLKVYNIAGQLVATLTDGEQQPGYYAARWNGRTQEQYAAASGVYLVRLSYGNQTRTEKLVKVR